MISGGLSVQGNLELWLRGVSPLKMYRIKRQILCERKCTKTTSLMLGVLRLLRATKKLASNNLVYTSLHKSTRARIDAPQLSTWKQTQKNRSRNAEASARGLPARGGHAPPPRPPLLRLAPAPHHIPRHPCDSAASCACGRSHPRSDPAGQRAHHGSVNCTTCCTGDRRSANLSVARL